MHHFPSSPIFHFFLKLLIVLVVAFSPSLNAMLTFHLVTTCNNLLSTCIAIVLVAFLVTYKMYFCFISSIYTHTHTHNNHILQIIHDTGSLHFKLFPNKQDFISIYKVVFVRRHIFFVRIVLLSSSNLEDENVMEIPSHCGIPSLDFRGIVVLHNIVFRHNVVDYGIVVDFITL